MRQERLAFPILLGTPRCGPGPSAAAAPLARQAAAPPEAAHRDDPQEPDPFSNLNPDFYRHCSIDVAGRACTTFLSTLDTLVVGQSLEGTGWTDDMWHTVPSEGDVLIEALNLTLLDSLRLPGGRCVLRCKRLLVPAIGSGQPLVIDVSPEPAAYFKEPWAGAPTVEQAGQAAADGDTIAAAVTAGRGAPYGASLPPAGTPRRYGVTGESGGSIEIIASEVVLEREVILRANGGPGYPGADGQSARQGPGGRAGAGGAGGAGGSVRLCYTRLTGTGEFSCETEAGAPGIPGRPGAGHPAGSEARPVAQGVPGTLQWEPAATTEDQHADFSVSFLRKVVQHAHRHYLTHPPIAHADGSTRLPGTEWSVLGDLLAWVRTLIAAAPQAEGELESLRRRALERQADTLHYRYLKALTAMGDEPNWVGGLDLASLEQELGFAVARRHRLEALVQSMAKHYEAEEKHRVGRLAKQQQLELKLAVHEGEAKGYYQSLKPLEQDALAAMEAFATARETLLEALHAFEAQVKKAYNCDIRNIVDAAGMCVFMGVGAGTAVMGAVQGVGLWDQATTTLKNDKGETLNKGILIQSLRTVDARIGLVQEGRALFTADAPPRLASDTRYLLASLDDLDEQVTSLTQALGSDATDATHLAIKTFKHALLDKAQAQMAFTQCVLHYTEARAQVDAAEKEQALAKRAGTAFTPEWLETCVALGELYHAQVVRIFMLLDRMRRKVDYLTLGQADEAEHDESQSLWLLHGRPLPAHAEQAILGQMESWRIRLNGYVEAQASVQTPVPPDPGARGTLMACIEDTPQSPHPLLEALRTRGSMTFRLVLGPSRSTDEVALDNGHTFHGLRATHVQPRILGASTDDSRAGKTRHPLLDIQIVSGSENGIVDRYGTLHTFQGAPRVAICTHRLDTRADSDRNDDLGQGGLGTLSGLGASRHAATSNHTGSLDAVGVLGTWTIKARPSDGPRDNNHGLDLSQVRKVQVHFRCLAHPVVR